MSIGSFGSVELELELEVELSFPQRSPGFREFFRSKQLNNRNKTRTKIPESQVSIASKSSPSL